MDCFRVWNRDGVTKRRLYERLPEHDDLAATEGGSLRKPKRRIYRIASATILSLLIVLSLSHPSVWSLIAQSQPVTHHEKIPTFLSVRHETGDADFIYALDNPLYDQLQQAILVNSHLQSQNNNSTSSLQVGLSTTTLTQQQEALILTWSSPHPSYPKSDVWVLYCGKNDDTLWQYDNIYEAATVAQIDASNQFTCAMNNAHACPTSTTTDQFWYIPNFPSWHRQPTCQFVLYRRHRSRGQLLWKALAMSQRLNTLKAVTSPTNLHLALTHHPTEMTIQFVSGQGTPIVAYATAANPSKWIQERVPGSSKTYTNTDLCMAPANETGPGKFQSPGLLHTVNLTGLVPNTKYVYKAGIQHGQGVTWSDIASFTTAPLVDDESIYPFSYLVYADQGCPLNGWTQGAAFTAAVVAQEIASNASVRMVHHFGDLSYAQGAAHQWDAWHAMIEPIARAVPYHISVGNHEYDYTAGGADKDPTGNTVGYHPVWGNFHDDSGGECGVPTNQRFKMPASPGGVFWYAHNFANTHTIVLSAEHDLAPGSVQYEWLAADLAAVDRFVTPWLIVEVHRPLYEGEAVWEQNDVGIALRMELEHLLHDYQVDVVLGGHYHAYHRTCDGLYKGQCHRPGGAMHITVGTAGAHLDEADLFENPWSAVYIKGTYGYGRVTVHNATDMLFEFVRGAASENDPQAGEILDSIWIHRKR